MITLSSPMHDVQTQSSAVFGRMVFGQAVFGYSITKGAVVLVSRMNEMIEVNSSMEDSIVELKS